MVGTGGTAQGRVRPEAVGAPHAEGRRVQFRHCRAGDNVQEGGFSHWRRGGRKDGRQLAENFE